MSLFFRTYFTFALGLLLATLVFGLLSVFAFLYPFAFNKFLPFYQLRPFHVSAALFWIISGATAGIIYYKRNAYPKTHNPGKAGKIFLSLWIGTVIAIFVCYALRIFGGREYWEFPPVLGLPLLAAWLYLMWLYFQSPGSGRPTPLYAWMWSTGIFFFLFTFLEQNLWQIPWFRSSFLKEVTVQWKANGATVGAWNQMIYGTALYLMVNISGDVKIANSKKAFFFYFLGLSNLMFNWGHHFYNLPGASWIRTISYVVSMSEWLIFISIVRGFTDKLDEARKLKHLVTYRFLLAAEFWVFVNLFLALLMSVPALNRYTHGTHITVAHAMGTTIGINTMILLASIGYILKIDGSSNAIKRQVNTGFKLAQASLLVFWLSLVAAGVLKGYRTVAIGMTDFREMMKPVIWVMHITALSGLGLTLGIGSVAVCYMKLIFRKNEIAGHPMVAVPEEKEYSLP